MSKKKYYIAYGSNLSVEQMAVRCPDARVVGNAVLYGWQLLFRGCATIEPNPARNTPVLVWEISERDERNLDRYEGFPRFYYKKDLTVEVFPLGGGETVALTAMVYIMTEGHRLSEPYPDYYKVLEGGYRDFHFPIHVLEQALADSIGRKEAIAVLGKWGLTGAKKKITIRCHGNTEEWSSREEAKALYRRAIAGSEGAERERYVKIYFQLEEGRMECTDEED